MDVHLVVDDVVVLTVEDDGVGPSAEARATDAGGMGLPNLANRAARRGGTFSLEPRQDRGSRAEWRVPRE